ncbi:cytochrome P450 [Mycolicibacterium sp.]|uniref:cytochrome P450 n=1 Tax=Mycolicibacterium sp. TaxID=2320850 RepID=UPI003D132095
MTTTAEPVMSIPDLSDTATFADDVPHDVFDELRRRPGWYWQPTDVGTMNGGFWVVTRHADVVEVEKNPTVFSNRRGIGYPQTTLPLDPEHNPASAFITLSDPPIHTALRKVASKAFGPRIVRQFKPWVSDIVTEALDNIEALDEFDIVAELAAIIPSYVIVQIMGVPRRDRQKIVDWANGQVDAVNTYDLDRLARGREELIAYFNESLWGEKLRNPSDDMTTVVVQAYERGEITRDQAHYFLLVLVGAGFETTHTAIAHAMRMMLEDDDVLQRMRAAIPQVGMDAVVTEFLRVITPVMHMARTALEDTEICGQRVRRDDLVLLYYSAANRDPAVFSNPHVFDPLRPETGALTFGTGIHRCLGFALAKLELSILFEQIAQRGVQLRLNGTPRRGNSVFINQLSSLPVARVRTED